jgi:hypothetical protein
MVIVAEIEEVKEGKMREKIEPVGWVLPALFT